MNHPHEGGSLEVSAKIQKGMVAQRHWGTLTDGVHPCDHLILAHVVAGLVLSRAPRVKQQALNAVSLEKR